MDDYWDASFLAKFEHMRICVNNLKLPRVKFYITKCLFTTESVCRKVERNKWIMSRKCALEKKFPNSSTNQWRFSVESIKRIFFSQLDDYICVEISIHKQIRSQTSRQTSSIIFKNQTNDKVTDFSSSCSFHFFVSFGCYYFRSNPILVDLYFA